MCVAACLAAFVVVSVSSGARAQEPQPEVSPEPAPPADSTTLPEVVVETTEQEQAAPQKKPTSSSSQSSGQSASAPLPTSTSGVGERQPETAYGPFNGYAATRSASGTKTDTPLNEIPQAITVVGAEQIQDMNAQTLQEVLRYAPGVVADTYGLDSRADAEKIRGTDAVHYLDGLRRTFSYYLYDYRIDPFFMERVEVLRGPASVLFGQGEVGGIINSVSKLPQTEESGEVTVEYGTFDYKQVKFDTTGPATEDGKWSYRVTGPCAMRKLKSTTSRTTATPYSLRSPIDRIATQASP